MGPPYVHRMLVGAREIVGAYEMVHMEIMILPPQRGAM